MTKLIRDVKTGDYYTEDKHYLIEKGYTGWNVKELENRGKYEIYAYSFTCQTLREVRESIEIYDSYCRQKV